MARGKKAKKQPQKIISIVDLRQQHPKGGLKTLEVPEAAFKSMMKKEDVLCFKYATYEKLFGEEAAPEEQVEEGQAPEEQVEEEGQAAAEAAQEQAVEFSDVWCPAVFDHQEFTVVDSDDIVFVDAVHTKYTPLLSLLRTRKLEDDKRRYAIEEALVREEEMGKLRSSSKKEKAGSSKQSTSKHEEVKASTSKLEEVIIFTDLRFGGRMSKLPISEFMAYVQNQNVVCYNYTAYTKVYKVQEPLERLQTDLPSPQVWIPGTRKLHEFLLREVVYIDTQGPLQACVLEEEQEQQPEQPEFEEQEQSAGEIQDSEEENKEQQQEDDEWQRVQSKGSKATVKEVLNAVDGRLSNISDSFVFFMHEVRDMKRSIEEVKHSVAEVNASVSRSAERSSRWSFAEFYERLYPGVSVAPPITNKVLPYTVKASLEALGKLCSISGLVGKHMCARPTPLHAEIDILLKVSEQGADYSAVSPDIGQGRVRMTTADDGSTIAFSHAVLGEVTRSIALCASWRRYQHPTKLSSSPSSKLLYKFVQLERGIIATMDYYGVDVDCIGGAAIISPSFARLAQPRRLASEVFRHCPAGLENVRALYDECRFWLLDI